MPRSRLPTRGVDLPLVQNPNKLQRMRERPFLKKIISTMKNKRININSEREREGEKGKEKEVVEYGQETSGVGLRRGRE